MLQRLGQPEVDADQAIKAAKETWAFPGTEGQVACRSCLQPVTIYGWDLNGDPVYDPTCSDCVAKAIMRRIKSGRPVPITPDYPREHCNRCYDRKPMPGTAWCAPCAIASNEALRGKEPDAFIDANIKKFRSRMSEPGPG